MDPTAFFQQWLDQKFANLTKDASEVRETANNLLEWLNNGGFEPDQWTDPEHGSDLKAEFKDWCLDAWHQDEEAEIIAMLGNAAVKEK